MSAQNPPRRSRRQDKAIKIHLPEYHMEVYARQTSTVVPVVHDLEVRVREVGDDESFLMDVAITALMCELLIEVGADSWMVGRMDNGLILPLA